MKTLRARVAGSVLALLIALMASDAFGAVVRQAGLEELVGSSAVIFHGRVALVDESPADGPTKRFVTKIHFEIIEPIAGLPAEQQTLVLDVPGGRRANRTLVIPGMPRFLPGDEVVLLLEKIEGRDQLIFTGLAQGVYWVRRDGLGPRVHRNLGELTLVRGSEHSHGGLEQAGSLQGLLAQLRKLTFRGTP